eukprot:scaffold3084_cov144-Cylindrotheca_fusiformis.AAC.63
MESGITRTAGVCHVSETMISKIANWRARCSIVLLHGLLWCEMVSGLAQSRPVCLECKGMLAGWRAPAGPTTQTEAKN